MSYPKTIKAAVSTADKKVTVKEIPIPSFAPNEVLIKVHSGGVNPSDWKHVAYGLIGEGVVVGCDFAGEVVALGADVKGVAIGDRLAGVYHGNKNNSTGAFAQYTNIDPLISFKIPEGVSYDQAASLPAPFFTAAHSLFNLLQLSEDKRNHDEWVLVWSGASGVGFHAIQLAKIYGYKVVTTASPLHNEILKAAGADLIFDYNDPDVSQKIREATGDSIKYALDSISNDQTTRNTALSLGPNGQIVLVGRPKTDDIPRKDVKFQSIALYTAFGKEVKVFGITLPAQPEHRAFQERWQKVLESLLSENKIKFLNLEIRGGLNAVDSAYADMAAGKNRATRYIVHPQQE